MFTTDRFLVVVTIAIILTETAYFYCWILPALYHQQNLVLSVFATLLFTIILILMIASYYKAVVTSPGTSLDLNFDLSQKQMQTLMDSSKVMQLNKLRRNKKKYKEFSQKQKKEELQYYLNLKYCTKCNYPKPNRYHHCSDCQKCVQRMDHHCPWINNCVGKNNHKFFILFQFYILILCFIISALGIFLYLQDHTESYVSLQNIGFCWMMGVAFLSLFIIGYLLIIQIRLAAQNLTFVQTLFDVLANQNPYTKNSWELNFKQIMGDSFWFVPTPPVYDKQKQPLKKLDRVTQSANNMDVKNFSIQDQI